MKELSIEQKAKRYDETIERAKKVLLDCTPEERKVVEYITSELKEHIESEDERIRKALVEMVHDTTGDSLWIDYNVHKEDALAWLEKQGEQNLANSAKTCKDEQKPADKVEPKFKIGDKIVEKDFGECSCGTIIDIKDGKYIFDDGGFICIEEQGLWKLVKQKPAWSEEDEKIYQSIMDDTVQENQLNGKQTDWLRSIKYRYFPQPKQEWSEEDESMHTRCIGILGKCYMGELPTKVEEELNWLKSLKDKYTWKPSDEQMKAIEHICDGNFNVDLDILDSIYRDFKKLRED